MKLLLFVYEKYEWQTFLATFLAIFADITYLCSVVVNAQYGYRCYYATFRGGFFYALMCCLGAFLPITDIFTHEMIIYAKKRVYLHAYPTMGLCRIYIFICTAPREACGVFFELSNKP